MSDALHSEESLRRGLSEVVRRLSAWRPVLLHVQQQILHEQLEQLPSERLKDAKSNSSRWTPSNGRCGRTSFLAKLTIKCIRYPRSAGRCRHEAPALDLARSCEACSTPAYCGRTLVRHQRHTRRGYTVFVKSLRGTYLPKFVASRSKTPTVTKMETQFDTMRAYRELRPETKWRWLWAFRGITLLVALLLLCVCISAFLNARDLWTSRDLVRRLIATTKLVERTPSSLKGFDDVWQKIQELLGQPGLIKRFGLYQGDSIRMELQRKILFRCRRPLPS